MKYITPVLIIVLATGCTPFLRPYDGTIGYKTSRNGDVVVIEYINEKGISEKKARAHIEQACRATLGETKNPLQVEILSTESLQSSRSLTGSAPQHAEATGSFKSSNGSEMRRWINKDDYHTIKIELVKFKATCSAPVASVQN